MLQALPDEHDKKYIDDDSWNILKERIIEETKYSMSAEFNQYRFLDDIFQNNTLAVFKETKLKFGCSCKRKTLLYTCLLYTSPSPRDLSTSRMPSSA